MFDKDDRPIEVQFDYIWQSIKPGNGISQWILFCGHVEKACSTLDLHLVDCQVGHRGFQLRVRDISIRISRELAQTRVLQGQRRNEISVKLKLDDQGVSISLDLVRMLIFMS